jgi:hypothetical protein
VDVVSGDKHLKLGTVAVVPDDPNTGTADSSIGVTAISAADAETTATLQGNQPTIL